MKYLCVCVGVVWMAFMSGCTSGVPNDAKPLETAVSGHSGITHVSTARVVLLRNSDAPVILKWGGVEDSVRWIYHKQATGKNIHDAYALLGLVQVFMEFSGDTIRFTTRTPATVVGYTISTLLRLDVPFRMPCVIDGVNGTTTVADLGANLVMRNVRGVTVQRHNASCDIVSLDGGVECEVALPPGGSCIIRAVRGTIILKVPTNTSANVTARATNGTITHTNLVFTGLNQQGGSLTGILGAGNGQIRVETDAGNIVLQGILP